MKPFRRILPAKHKSCTDLLADFELISGGMSHGSSSLCSSSLPLLLSIRRRPIPSPLAAALALWCPAALPMAERVREHPLLRSMHAAVQLHRAFIVQQQAVADPAATNLTAAPPAASAESSSPADAGCPRCAALCAAATAAASAASDISAHSQLYRDALALSSPFETLSPNLSQLAFAVQPQPQPRSPATSEGRGASPADAVADAGAVAPASFSASFAASTAPAAASNAAAPLSLSELLTPEGFLRWESFAPLVAASATASATTSASSSAAADASFAPAAGSSFSPTSSCAESIYALSSSLLVSACRALHSWLRRMDSAEFQRRYSGVQCASHHGSTLRQLFEMYKSGCNDGEDAAPNHAAAASSSSSEALSPGDGVGPQRQLHSVGLVLMVISSHTERVLGDIFQACRASHSLPVPRMLRDLLASPEVASALPAEALHLIQSLIGSPRAFNLRNILWHGFLPLVDPQTNVALEAFTAATILLHLSILKECIDKIWPPNALSTAGEIGQEVKEDSAVAAAPAPAVHHAPRRPLKHKFPGDAALTAHLSSALFAPADHAASAVAAAASPSAASSSTFASPSASAASADHALAFPSAFDVWPIPPSLVCGSCPSSFASLTSDLRSLLASSYFLPHHRLHDMLHAWELLPHNPYLALAALMPVVESVMRQWFVYTNAQVGEEGTENDRIEAGLLLAQSERLFTTMDIVLGPRVDPLVSGAEGEANASPSPPPTLQPQMKCDRTSAFAFPLVASACSFPSSPSPQHNALYRPVLPDLPALPGAGLMLALSELLISRVGPRLRDRVAHGEITWIDGQGGAHCSNKTLEPWLVLYAFNIVVAMAVQFPLCAPAAATPAPSCPSPSHTPPALLQLPSAFSSTLALRATSWLSNYIPVGHARSITFQRLIDASRGIGQMESHLIGWEQEMARITASSNNDAGVSSEGQPSAAEAPSLRAPVGAWYSLLFTHPPDFIQSRLCVLESECSSSQGTGMESMALWANRLAVQAGVLLQSMMRKEPTMPLWTMMPSWLFGPAVARPDPAALVHWWTLWHDQFWSRSHCRFHHEGAGDDASCSLTCIVHCHDHCMSHAPILCLERMFDTMPALLLAFNSGYSALQDLAAGPAAPSGKRRLAEQVQEALPAVIACCATTAAALALLWEHMHVKAHDPMLAAASPGSSSASPPSSSDLLRRDRSIARLLKKCSGALDRVRLLYATNRWLLAMHEWAIILQAIQAWIEVGWVRAWVVERC